MTPPVQADITTQPAVAARPTASDTQAIQLAQQPAEPNQQPAEPNQQPAEQVNVGQQMEQRHHHQLQW